MEPDFTKRYKARVKVYKPSGVPSVKEFTAYTEEIEVVGQDFNYAYQAAQEYLKILITNNGWFYGEVLMICYHGDLFLGIALTDEDEPMGLPENGSLNKGFNCLGGDEGL